MNARSLVTSAILAPPATPKACCLVGDKYGDSEQPAKVEEGRSRWGKVMEEEEGSK